MAHVRTYLLDSSQNQASHGRGGDDTLVGTDERDHLVGGGHADTIDGGLENDSLNGGGGGDWLTGGAGADRMNGGGGSDHFVYTAATESTGADYDTIIGFNGRQDSLTLPVAVTGIGDAVDVGTLSDATFDTDLTAAMALLPANNAALFTPDAGDLEGKTFLVVDVNGIAGYQAGEDLVVHLQGGAHHGELDIANFSV